MTRRALSPVTLAVLVTILLAMLGGPSPTTARAAQVSGPNRTVGQEPETRLVVARITGVTGRGSVPDGVSPPDRVLLRVLVEHRGSAPLVDADVVVETHGRLTSRGLLRQAMDDGIVGVPRRVISQPVREGAAVEPGDIAAVDVLIEVDRLTESGASGVYPVQVSLRRGSELLDHVVTAVVNLAERPSNPLATVAVWPVDAPPASSGEADPRFEDAVRAGGRLDDLVAALEGVQDLPIVAAVSTHLLDRLALEVSDEGSTDPEAAPESAGRRLLDRLRSVLGRLPLAPVTGPYAEADLSVLVEAGTALADMGGELAVNGPRRFEAVSGRAPDPRAVLTTAPVTARSLDLLPGGHLLLPWDAVSEQLPEGDLPSPLRELRASSGAVLTASIADPWLAEAMARGANRHGSAVAVQRVLAETALVQFEAPGVADRPLLLLPPRDWDPGGRVARDLAVAVARAPWLRLVAPSEHAALVDDPPITVLAERVDRIQPILIDQLKATLGDLAGIRASLPPGVEQLDGRGLAGLGAQLRRATSHWFVDEPALALAMVADVGDAIDAAYGRVEIPTATGFTLLGERQEIPITIHRASGDDLVVDVEVRSGGALAWPSGDTQRRQLVAGERQTLSFEVQARARGDVRVDVIVRDAAGARVLAEATIRVRSTFISRPALAIVAGVIVLLLLIGRRRRRPDDPEAALVTIGSGDDADRGQS